MIAAAIAALGLVTALALPGWWRRGDGGRSPVPPALAIVALGAACGAAVVAPAVAPASVTGAIAAALGILAAAVGGGPVTELVLGQVGRDAVARSVDAEAVLRGGAWIGALERLGIAGAVLAGSVEAIAIVLAVKGLGRYAELKGGEGAGTAERFIIGTFTSALWAVAAAGVARLLWLGS